MLIGEVVSITGLTRDTIRFYEKKGLIKVKRSESQWNNYKDYDSHTIRQLSLIKEGKGLGFTLNEIAELLELIEDNQASCEVLSVKIKGKLQDIDQKIYDLQAMKQMILNRIGNLGSECNSSISNCQTILKVETA